MRLLLPTFISFGAFSTIFARTAEEIKATWSSLDFFEKYDAISELRENHGVIGALTRYEVRKVKGICMHIDRQKGWNCGTKTSDQSEYDKCLINMDYCHFLILNTDSYEAILPAQKQFSNQKYTDRYDMKQADSRDETSPFILPGNTATFGHFMDLLLWSMPMIGRTTSFCPPGGCSVAFNLEKIWNYGCWCNFNENLMKGVGQPLDIFDSLCKNYQNCLRCARYDENLCDPKTESFQAIGSWAPSDEALLMKCSEANGSDDCKTYVCSCHTTLIAELIKLLWIPNTPIVNPSFKHPSFDPSTCGNNGGAGDNDHSCCGNYPERYPFALGQADCCDNKKIYQPMSHQCCNYGDGTTAPTGTCP